MERFKTVNKKQFLTELIDVFIDGNFFGYTCNGGSHDTSNNVIVLDMSKEVNGGFEDVAIKIDLSKAVIEVGTHEFPDEAEDGIFTPMIKIE